MNTKISTALATAKSQLEEKNKYLTDLQTAYNQTNAEIFYIQGQISALEGVVNSTAVEGEVLPPV